ncbi:Arc family DNA-binding protein [Bradyrhizobium barranii subsp. apii]|nr:Arc family DNA-binding protein [Bradyrhizobium barranii]UPT97251.1 Arc family DNA-binding protein [Bradyrhizobium barranii subsp. apii]
MIALHLRVPADVREQLQAWAERNVSSMTCELVRAVRERAAREQQKEAAR